ncbi:MAG TPA: saccharopine dehydrogenase NADP-binding domain-containing protein, partial [Draconibacterium sp.]|nr:saccharopine dehydrogenase NADP-binding domain-containing protein [Draconibacterium sp.]
MSKVLIIGAGGVGRVVASKCADNPEVFSEILLASRTVSKCDVIAKEVGKGRIKTASLNADNVADTVALIK